MKTGNIVKLLCIVLLLIAAPDRMEAQSNAQTFFDNGVVLMNKGQRQTGTAREQTLHSAISQFETARALTNNESLKTRCSQHINTINSWLKAKTTNTTRSDGTNRRQTNSSNRDDIYYGEPDLTLTPARIEFEPTDSMVTKSASFTFSPAKKDYTCPVKAKPDWCDVKFDSTTCTFTFTALKPNEKTAPDSFKIDVSWGTVKNAFTIVRKGRDFSFTTDKSTVFFDANGSVWNPDADDDSYIKEGFKKAGKFAKKLFKSKTADKKQFVNVSCSSGHPYMTENGKAYWYVQAISQPWIHAVPTNPQNGALQSVSISVDEYKGTAREGTITLQALDKKVSIKVYQDGGK